MIGSHLIKAWSRTQNHVTLSSAEAELYAMVKCTAELMGIRSMMADWGRTKSVTIATISITRQSITVINIMSCQQTIYVVTISGVAVVVVVVLHRPIPWTFSIIFHSLH